MYDLQRKRIEKGVIIMNETDAQQFDDTSAFNILKIICFAMIFSVLSVGTVSTIIIGVPQSTSLEIFPSGFGIFITVISITVAVVFLSSPIQQWKKPASEKPVAESWLEYKASPTPQDQLPKSKEELAYGEWQTTELIRFAMLEGFALVNLILGVFIDHGNIINLACSGVIFSLMIGVFFPSRNVWEEYRNNRVAELDSEGWQPPQSPDPVA
jgi:hypothetical protein